MHGHLNVKLNKLRLFVNISVSRHAVNVIVFTLIRKAYHSQTQIFTKRIFQSSFVDFSCNGNLI